MFVCPPGQWRSFARCALAATSSSTARRETARAGGAGWCATVTFTGWATGAWVFFGCGATTAGALTVRVAGRAADGWSERSLAKGVRGGTFPGLLGAGAVRAMVVLAVVASDGAAGWAGAGAATGAVGADAMGVDATEGAAGGGVVLVDAEAAAGDLTLVEGAGGAVAGAAGGAEPWDGSDGLVVETVVSLPTGAGATARAPNSWTQYGLIDPPEATPTPIST